MSLNVNRMIKLAADHVDWFSEILKPLLRSWMEHGYKHGWDDALKYAACGDGTQCEEECSD